MDGDARRRAWEERHASATAPPPASPFVLGVLDRLAAAADARSPRRALDVACGAGRHTLALAARGYRVTAVDYARPALARLRAAVGSHGLPVDLLVADVESWPLPAARFALVLVVDFLSRALLPVLRAAVAPGGVLLMETFTVGDAPPVHPRNPAYLLRPGELAAACAGWEVLATYEHGSDGPTPACRAGIAARAPR